MGNHGLMKCEFIHEEYYNNRANMTALYITAGFYFILLL